MPVAAFFPSEASVNLWVGGSVNQDCYNSHTLSLEMCLLDYKGVWQSCLELWGRVYLKCFWCVNTNTYPKAIFLLINTQVIGTVEKKTKTCFRYQESSFQHLWLLSLISIYCSYHLVIESQELTEPMLETHQVRRNKVSVEINRVLFYWTQNCYPLTKQSHLDLQSLFMLWRAHRAFMEG